MQLVTRRKQPAGRKPVRVPSLRLFTMTPLRAARHRARTDENDGEHVARSPLISWERYAQALLFADELIYVN